MFMADFLIIQLFLSRICLTVTYALLNALLLQIESAFILNGGIIKYATLARVIVPITFSP